MSARATVFVLPVGTALTAGDSTKLPGVAPSGNPLADGLDVAAHDVLALDFDVTSGSLTFFYDRKGADGNWYQVYTSGAVGTGQTASGTLAGQNSASQDFGLIGRIRWTGSGTASCSVTGR